ncbi:MAG: carbonate dehydratase, partial [Alphaproteobacteria bacterium HGW-Alphaproteobacteria-2]
MIGAFAVMAGLLRERRRPRNATGAATLPVPTATARAYLIGMLQERSSLSQSEWRVDPIRQPWAKPADDCLRALDSDADGLTAEETARRLAEHGPNRLPEPTRPSPLRRLARQFNNLLLFVLIAAAAITALLGHWIDTGVILAVVLANVGIGFVQEGRAEKALEALREMLAPRAAVLRDGRRQSIAAEELVPGDIVLLEAGDRVSADLRLVAVQNLGTQEAMLTGESEPVRKSTDPVEPGATLGDRLSMAFAGTMVTEGTARGVVTATGALTEIGRISGMLRGVEQLATPLIRQMNRFARVLTVFILGSSAALLTYSVMIGGRAFSEAFMIVVGLFVAAIPEGLPAALTVTLAIGVQAMARRHAVIRRLVTTLVTAGGRLGIAGEGYAPEGRVSPEDGAEVPDALRAAAADIAALCNGAALHRGKDGHWRVEGDPMEGALLALASRLGRDAKAGGEIAATIPFDARHRYMAVLRREDTGGLALVKGAPEAILDRAAQQLGRDGPEPLDRAFWGAQAEAIAAEGQRVLALAQMPHAGDGLDHDDLEGELVLVALAGLIDPPRDEAIAAVADCQRAG